MGTYEFSICLVLLFDKLHQRRQEPARARRRERGRMQPVDRVHQALQLQHASVPKRRAPPKVHSHIAAIRNRISD